MGGLKAMKTFRIIKKIIKRHDYEKTNDGFYIVQIGDYTTSGASKKELLKHVFECLKLMYK